MDQHNPWAAVRGLLLLMLLTPAVAAGATDSPWRVDPEDPACRNTPGETSAAAEEAPFCTLAAALEAASGGSPGAITLSLTPGSVHTLATVDHLAEGGNGLPAVTRELVIEGHGATLERSAQPGTAVFRLLRVAPEGRLTLRRLTLTGGATEPGYDGAAVWNLGHLVLEDCRLVNNHSGDDGGALRNDGRLTMRRSEVTDNQARGRGGTGGGLYNVGIGGAGVAVLEEVVFSDNQAGSSGGAVWNEGSLELVDSRLHDNQAIWGGGGLHNVGTARLVRTTVTDNRASVVGGGVRAHAPVILEDGRLAGNQAPIGPDCEGPVATDHPAAVTNPVDCRLEALEPRRRSLSGGVP